MGNDPIVYHHFEQFRRMTMSHRENKSRIIETRILIRRIRKSQWKYLSIVAFSLAAGRFRLLKDVCMSR
jgi:hypothetical protein